MERKNLHIILDYGHGSNTPGKQSPLYSTLTNAADKTYFSKFPEFGKERYKEYLSNRVIGKQIASKLKAKGYSVHEIITSDYDTSLSGRVALTNRICKQYGIGNCIFVSVHSNAAGNGGWYKARGWSAFTTKGQNNSDKLATCMYKYADKHFVADGQKIRKDNQDGDPDWEANFAVIKGANCIAVLTESFFYDNVDDLKYIVSRKGQDAIVAVHVEGIDDFCRIYKGVK